MYLIIQYYNDKNSERQKEYDFCLETNLNNPAIKEIHNIIEKDTIIPEKFKNNIKLKTKSINYLKTRSIPGRLTFEYIFDYIKENIPLDEVVCVANLDILLEYSNSWNNIKSDFFDVNNDKKVMCLSRLDILKDINNNYHIKSFFNCESLKNTNTNYNDIINLTKEYVFGIPNWWYILEQTRTFPGASSDCWVFKNDGIELDDCCFCVGNSIMMDGALHFRFVNKGYKVFNWCEKYKIFHYDLYRKPNPIVILNKNMCNNGRICYNRGGIEVPCKQNWTNILLNKMEPLYNWRGRTILLDAIRAVNLPKNLFNT